MQSSSICCPAAAAAIIVKRVKEEEEEEEKAKPKRFTFYIPYSSLKKRRITFILLSCFYH